MKMLRLLGLAFALTAVVVVAHARPAFAACIGRCTSNQWCVNCTGEPEAVCLGGRCAF